MAGMGEGRCWAAHPAYKKKKKGGKGSPRRGRGNELGGANCISEMETFFQRLKSYAAATTRKIMRVGHEGGISLNKKRKYQSMPLRAEGKQEGFAEEMTLRRGLLRPLNQVKRGIMGFR